MKTSTTSLLIRTNGTMEIVNPSNTRKGWTLDELYGHLACDMVEVVYPNRISPAIGFLKSPILICDEEGQLTGKEINPFASMLAGQPIVGDVILCESKSFK